MPQITKEMKRTARQLGCKIILSDCGPSNGVFFVKRFMARGVYEYAVILASGNIGRFSYSMSSAIECVQQ